MKRISIYIGVEQKGFLLSLSRILQEKYQSEVTIICEDENVRQYVRRNYVDFAGKLIVYNQIIVDHIDDSIMEGLKIEDKYHCKLSMLISQDRAYGQGYNFNIQNIPFIRRSEWSHHVKIKNMINEILRAESVISNCDIYIRRWIGSVDEVVASKYCTKIYSLSIAKFGDRLLWSDNGYLTNNKYVGEIIKNVESDNLHEYSEEFKTDVCGDRIIKHAKYSYIDGVYQAAKLLLKDVARYRHLKQYGKHRVGGWFFTRIRRVSHYKWMKKYGLEPQNVKRYKIIYFPLHMEPEISLLKFSPEFNNSMEAISLISKCLPCDTLIVVKEQVHSYGVRSRWFYKTLNKLGNVVFSKPDILSEHWIKESCAVATISGTVGVEAVHYNKPVLSFGKHQPINYLPSVIYASNYSEVKAAVSAIISGFSDVTLEKSRVSLKNAQIDSSFELTNFKDTWREDSMQDDMANIAADELMKDYMA